MKALNGMDEIMTPAEFILTRGYCMYCETPINGDDRCGCDGETIYYLTKVVEIMYFALSPLAGVWQVELKYQDISNLDAAYIWYPSDYEAIHSGISFADAKRAHEALEKVELML